MQLQYRSLTTNIDNTTILMNDNGFKSPVYLYLIHYLTTFLKLTSHNSTSFEINNVLLVEKIPFTLVFTHYEWTTRLITVNVKRKLDPKRKRKQRYSDILNHWFKRPRTDVR